MTGTTIGSDARHARIRAGVAMALAGVFAVLLAVALVFEVRSGTVGLGDAITGATLLITQAVGLVVAVRRPDNNVGLIVCALALVLALQTALTAYAASQPSAGVIYTAALWVNAKSFLLVWAAVMALLFHFPTGRLPSPRWRGPWRVTLATVIYGIVVMSLRPGHLDESRPPGAGNPQNPTGLTQSAWEPIAFLEPLGLMVLVPCLVAALASLIVRYRTSARDERLQIRWVVTAAVAFVMVMLVNVAIRHLVPELLAAVDAAAGLAFVLIPLAVGVAILRRRLYDIDRVINRTVVYALLSTALAGVYALFVTILGAFTGAGDSALPVAASTLAVAGLFQPARRRIQVAVDQRFNRARYNAAATITTFSARLRDEVDLATLETDLIAVVRATMQPATSALWLREGPA